MSYVLPDPGHSRTHPDEDHVPSASQRIIYKIEDVAMAVNWIHVAFKICAYTYIAFMAWIAWHVLPLPGHWSLEHKTLPVTHDLTSYFESFHGGIECKLKADHLYLDQSRNNLDTSPQGTFCTNRQELLESMTRGGRIGYDAPYIPKDCQYGWYDVDQICMIMERFDGVIFIGDESLQPVYSGLNILLRQNLLHGALQTKKMNSQELSDCGCENQFNRRVCLDKAISSSDDIPKDAADRRPDHDSYVCSRVPHAFLKIDGGSPRLPAHVTEQFNAIAPHRPPSYFKHIPIVVSFSTAMSLSTSTQSAQSALLSIIDLADKTGRNTDILYIGPTAPGHITLRNHKNNQDIWNFHHAVVQTANENNVDVLGMWNLTLQANSWDGVRFREAVAITQAMMVVNWLSRLETS